MTRPCASRGESLAGANAKYCNLPPHRRHSFLCSTRYRSVPLIGTEDPPIAMDLRGRVPFVSPSASAAEGRLAKPCQELIDSCGIGDQR